MPKKRKTTHIESSKENNKTNNTITKATDNDKIKSETKEKKNNHEINENHKYKINYETEEMNIPIKNNITTKDNNNTSEYNNLMEIYNKLSNTNKNTNITKDINTIKEYLNNYKEYNNIKDIILISSLHCIRITNKPLNQKYIIIIIKLISELYNNEYNIPKENNIINISSIIDFILIHKIFLLFRNKDIIHFIKIINKNNGKCNNNDTNVDNNNDRDKDNKNNNNIITNITTNNNKDNNFYIIKIYSIIIEYLTSNYNNKNYNDKINILRYHFKSKEYNLISILLYSIELYLQKNRNIKIIKEIINKYNKEILLFLKYLHKNNNIYNKNDNSYNKDGNTNNKDGNIDDKNNTNTNTTITTINNININYKKIISLINIKDIKEKEYLVFNIDCITYREIYNNSTNRRDRILQNIDNIIECVCSNISDRETTDSNKYMDDIITIDSISTNKDIMDNKDINECKIKKEIIENNIKDNNSKRRAIALQILYNYIYSYNNKDNNKEYNINIIFNIKGLEDRVLDKNDPIRHMAINLFTEIHKFIIYNNIDNKEVSDNMSNKKIGNDNANTNNKEIEDNNTTTTNNIDNINNNDIIIFYIKILKNMINGLLTDNKEEYIRIFNHININNNILMYIYIKDNNISMIEYYKRYNIILNNKEIEDINNTITTYINNKDNKYNKRDNNKDIDNNNVIDNNNNNITTNNNTTIIKNMNIRDKLLFYFKFYNINITEDKIINLIKIDIDLIINYFNRNNKEDNSDNNDNKEIEDNTINSININNSNKDIINTNNINIINNKIIKELVYYIINNNNIFIINKIIMILSKYKINNTEDIKINNNYYYIKYIIDPIDIEYYNYNYNKDYNNNNITTNKDIEDNNTITINNKYTYSYIYYLSMIYSKVSNYDKDRIIKIIIEYIDNIEIEAYKIIIIISNTASMLLLERYIYNIIRYYDNHIKSNKDKSDNNNMNDSNIKNIIEYLLEYTNITNSVIYFILTGNINITNIKYYVLLLICISKGIIHINDNNTKDMDNNIKYYKDYFKRMFISYINNLDSNTKSLFYDVSLKLKSKIMYNIDTNSNNDNSKDNKGIDTKDINDKGNSNNIDTNNTTITNINNTTTNNNKTIDYTTMENIKLNNINISNVNNLNRFINIYKNLDIRDRMFYYLIDNILDNIKEYFNYDKDNKKDNNNDNKNNNIDTNSNMNMNKEEMYNIIEDIKILKDIEINYRDIIFSIRFDKEWM